jgi:ABC-type branched-subunit amino acid transport system substrate-binding protein
MPVAQITGTTQRGHWTRRSPKATFSGTLMTRITSRQGLARFIVACLAWSLPAFSVLAQGVTANTITIGQSGALTGPSDEQGKELRAGIEAYFNVVNQAGGIGGRKLKLISLDDAGGVDQAKANTLKLINEDGVLALVGYNGEHTIKAVLGAIDKAKVPLIGAASGDQSLHESFNRYVFNTRASYFDETDRIVDQYVKRGVNKIAMFYQNDPFGRAGLAGLDKAMRDRKLAIALFGSVDRNSTNVATAAQNIHKSGAQAVVIATGARTGSAFIREMKKLGSTAQFFLLSTAGAKTLASTLGDEARGVGVSQVVPLPTTESEALGKEYVKNIGGLANTSFASLEGYIAAKVLVEGIRKAGRTPTRESLVDALDRTGSIDLAGYKLKFSPANHNGSSFVDLTVIGSQGLYRR